MNLIFNTIEHVYLVIRDMAMRFSPLKHYQNDFRNFQPELFERVFHRIRHTVTYENSLHWRIKCVLNKEERETHVFLLRAFDASKPSIIFHHGAGQINHWVSAKTILGSVLSARSNIFVIKAQKHGSAYEYLSEAVDTFLHQQQTFAGSILATEAIVAYHKKRSKKPVISSGASMGGIVSAWHAFFFGSADYYVPIVAYPNVGEIFLGTAYKSGVAGWAEKKKNRRYIESYKVKKTLPVALRKKIMPVLGQKDVIVPFDKAFAFWKKQQITPRSFPFGHFTSVIARKEIQHIFLSIIAP